VNAEERVVAQVLALQPAAKDFRVTQILDGYLATRDRGLTPCGHRARTDGCKLPDGDDHEPNCHGNPFEADGHERCPCCKLATCGEPALKERHASYEDSGTCIPCVMAQEQLSIQEVAAIFNRSG